MSNLIEYMKKVATKVKKVAKKAVSKRAAKKVVEVAHVHVFIDCRECGGAGLINATTLCSTCDGSGKA
jgi:RecJ-like exonuclease